MELHNYNCFSLVYLSKRYKQCSNALFVKAYKQCSNVLAYLSKRYKRYKRYTFLSLRHVCAYIII